MKKLKKTIIIAFSLFMIDLILTTYYIRNYYEYISEGNPFMNIGQGYLIFVPNIIYFIIIFILIKYIDKYSTIIIEANRSFDYFKRLINSDHYKFIFVSIATSFVYATIVSRIVVIIDWIVFGIYKISFFQTDYAKIRQLMPFGKFDLVVGLIAFIIFALLWYKFEYKKSKNILSNS